MPSVEAYEITGELGDTERGSGGFGSTGVREASTRVDEQYGKVFERLAREDD